VTVAEGLAYFNNVYITSLTSPSGRKSDDKSSSYRIVFHDYLNWNIINDRPMINKSLGNIPTLGENS